MSERFLPYGRQWIDGDDVDAVVACLHSDFLTTGPKVAEFEAALCAATGARYAAACNSGTSALHMAYHAAGLGPGDSIVTSPMTFVATANAARYLGAEVRLADVEPDTGNLDPDAAEAAIDETTKLLVTVDYAGHPVEYDRFREIADRRGLVLVADAAHSLGATYKGRAVGTLADLTEVSLHPVKPITTGEGGAVLTDREDWDARAKAFRTHGIVRDPAHMTRNEGPWYYEMLDLGFNYRLTDLQCALGLSQVGRLQAFVERRRTIARRYYELLKDVPELILPTVRPDVEPGWHLFVVRVAGDPARRLPFFNRLRELGLGVQVHYIPVHLHPYWERYSFRRGQFPVTEDFYARSVSIPIFPMMSEDDVQSSAERIRRAVKETL